MDRSFLRRLAAPALALALGACGGEAPTEAVDPPPAAAPPVIDKAALLDGVLAHPRRSEEERARDVWRHPKETLLFFGIEPDMTVVEIWPGGGWYANIIAPYLAADGGVYYAAGFDPNRSERAAVAVEQFAAKYADDAEAYGDVRLTTFGPGADIAPAASADAVLTFRNVHNWLAGDGAGEAFVGFAKALKPGGVLGVVEHRADEDQDDADGYVRESTVKSLAEDAGLVFIAASEINANPADTKDHPFGVWTLPPVRRSSAARGVEDPDFDRAKYDAVGESDRMTLLFQKPLSPTADAPSADEALAGEDTDAAAPVSE